MPDFLRGVEGVDPQASSYSQQPAADTYNQGYDQGYDQGAYNYNTGYNYDQQNYGGYDQQYQNTGYNYDQTYQQPR